MSLLSMSSNNISGPTSTNPSSHVLLKKMLRKGSLDRNIKTALILGLGASGALVSLPWFAATLAGTTIVVSIARYRQQV